MNDARLGALRKMFGSIDVYLFDQLLRGRLADGMRVLDAGCGSGRNLVYLLQNGFDVWAVDSEPDYLPGVRALFSREGRDEIAARVVEADLGALPFDDGAFDFVICNAVLHFATGHDDFDAMTRELGRVLAPGGLLFARLASNIGIEDRVVAIGDGRYRLPGGEEWYLVDEERLLTRTESLGAKLTDPIKTTNVQGQRCMTTWCARKRDA